MIAYYVDNSIHQIPSFIFITLETGGKVLTDGPDSYRYIKEEYPTIDVELLPSTEAVTKRAKELKPSAIVQPDFSHRLFTEVGAKQVQVFHGVSDKRYGRTKKVLQYDLNLLPGPKEVEEYRKMGILDQMSYEVIGYPKADRVFSGKLDKRAEMQKYELDPEKPTVLYAPTWNDGLGNTSIPRFGLEVIGGAPDDINLVVKLHPNTLRYDKKHYPKLKEAAEKKANVVLIDYAPDIIPVMAMADLMIGDISSVTHEFIIFQRPLIFLDSGFHFFQGKARTWIWQAGDVVKKKGQVWPTVLERLTHPEVYAEKRKEVMEQIFYKPDGNAAKRAATAIRKLVGEL